MLCMMLLDTGVWGMQLTWPSLRCAEINLVYTWPGPVWAQGGVMTTVSSPLTSGSWKASGPRVMTSLTSTEGHTYDGSCCGKINIIIPAMDSQLGVTTASFSGTWLVGWRVLSAENPEPYSSVCWSSAIVPKFSDDSLQCIFTHCEEQACQTCGPLQADLRPARRPL